MKCKKYEFLGQTTYMGLKVKDFKPKYKLLEVLEYPPNYKELNLYDLIRKPTCYFSNIYKLKMTHGDYYVLSEKVYHDTRSTSVVICKVDNTEKEL